MNKIANLEEDPKRESRKERIMDLNIFVKLANAFDEDLFPKADIDDLENGAYYVPSEVTIKRRQGECVKYDPVKKIWTFENGATIE